MAKYNESKNKKLISDLETHHAYPRRALHLVRRHGQQGVRLADPGQGHALGAAERQGQRLAGQDRAVQDQAKGHDQGQRETRPSGM